MTDKQFLNSAVRIFGPKVLGRISQSTICNALGLCDQKADGRSAGPYLRNLSLAGRQRNVAQA